MLKNLRKASLAVTALSVAAFSSLPAWAQSTVTDPGFGNMANDGKALIGFLTAGLLVVIAATLGVAVLLAGAGKIHRQVKK